MASTDIIKTALSYLEKAPLYVISNVNRRIAVVSITLVLLFTFVNSVSRYLIQAPIAGSVDIIRLILMPLTVWFYAATLQYNEGRSFGDPTSDEQSGEGNITVDFLTNRLSTETNELIKLLYLPFVIVILAGFVSISWNASMEAWQGQFWTSGAVELPIWFPRFTMTIGAFLLTVELLRQFLHLLVRVPKHSRAQLRQVREVISS